MNPVLSSVSVEYAVLLGSLAVVALWVLYRRTWTRGPKLPPMAPPSMLANIQRSGYPSLPHKVEMSDW
jgi:hypothetical protein